MAGRGPDPSARCQWDQDLVDQVDRAVWVERGDFQLAPKAQDSARLLNPAAAD